MNDWDETLEERASFPRRLWWFIWHRLLRRPVVIRPEEIGVQVLFTQLNPAVYHAAVARMMEQAYGMRTERRMFGSVKEWHRAGEDRS